MRACGECTCVVAIRKQMDTLASGGRPQLQELCFKVDCGDVHL